MSRSLLALLPYVLTLLLGVTTIVSRPALPVDETRYLTVAWEMYRDGNWLVPISTVTPTRTSHRYCSG